jgi:hypothetical protein
MAELNTVSVTPEITPESPEYIQEMAKKGEAVVNAGNTNKVEVTQDIPAKPEGIPDKFYNATTGEVDYVSMAKSYQELEKKIGQPKEDPKQAKETEPPKEKSEAPADEADKAVEKAGLDMVSLQQEFAEKGEISEASYEALEKAGISKETVDAYVAGQQALVEQVRTQAFTLTDGEDNYNAMVNWAVDNLSPEEIESFNNQVNTRNKGVRETVIRGLYSRFTSENGSGGNLVSGKTTSTPPASQGYASRAEMMTAMNDPKYKTDEAYRKTVADKVAKTNF